MFQHSVSHVILGERIKVQYMTALKSQNKVVEEIANACEKVKNVNFDHTIASHSFHSMMDAVRVGKTLTMEDISEINTRSGEFLKTAKALDDAMADLSEKENAFKVAEIKVENILIELMAHEASKEVLDEELSRGVKEGESWDCDHPDDVIDASPPGIDAPTCPQVTTTIASAFGSPRPGAIVEPLKIKESKVEVTHTHLQDVRVSDGLDEPSRRIKTVRDTYREDKAKVVRTRSHVVKFPDDLVAPSV